MSTGVERSRFYAQVDTADWSDPEVMLKAVFRPETLSAAERLVWLRMCKEIGLPPDPA